MGDAGGSASLAQILFQVLGPIAVLTGVGYVLQNRLHLDVRSLSRVVFYVLTPCLIYDSIVHLAIDAATIGRTLAFAGLYMLLMGLGAFALSRRSGYAGSVTSAFIVATILLNDGNYGLPLNLFAFGDAGFDYAVVMFIFNNLVGNTISIFLLAHGNHGAAVALRRTLTAPVIWAMAAGFLSRATGLAPSGSFEAMIQMAGRAAIPVFLLILGMTLAQTRTHSSRSAITRLTALRMVGGPGLAVVLAGVMGLTGLNYAVAVMQSSMPTAVNSIVLSNEFESAPDFVAGAVFLTTLVSLVTLPALLLWLK